MYTVQVVFLGAILSVLHIQAWAQGFYSTYNTPYQNSFAFATPNLKQVFTTKLASGPQSQQLSQEQVYSSPYQNTFANLQQSANLPPNSFLAQNNVYSTAAQQFPVQEDQLRQQLAFYQQQQMQQQLQQQLQQIQFQQQQQQQQQYLEQFQAPFVANQRDSNIERQPNQPVRDEVRTQQLLGVAYSPSTQVSQVKFDNGKLKYDF